MRIVAGGERRGGVAARRMRTAVPPPVAGGGPRSGAPEGSRRGARGASAVRGGLFYFVLSFSSPK